MHPRIVLLAKTDRFSGTAVAIAKSLFGEAAVDFCGNVGDPFPDSLVSAAPEYLISFLSPWIVPAEVLGRAGTSINFHPASVDYPGIGCYNFALYDEAPEFGAVCHHMLPKVDTGPIVEERRFPVFSHDTVESLKLRTMVTMTSMFHDICALIVMGQLLPVSDRRWTRQPYTRRELNDLKTISPEMSRDEIARRIRAGTYPGYPGPAVTIGDHTFYFPVPNRPALA